MMCWQHRYLLLALLTATIVCPCATATHCLPQDSLKIAETALINGNFGVAERQYLSALKDLENQPDKVTQLILCLRGLSSLYQIRGQFDKAEGYLERSVRLTGKTQPADSPELIAALSKLGQFYLQHGKPGKAEPVANTLLSLTEKQALEQKSICAHLSEAAKLLSKKPSYQQAFDHVRQGQVLYQSANANQCLEFAVALDALGVALSDSHKLLMAERLFRRALDLREATLPRGHLALSASYEHLALNYLQQGRPRDAEPLFRQALESAQSVYDGQHPGLCHQVDGLAKCLVALGKCEEAAQLYRGAVAAKPTPWNLLGLSAIYLKQGKYKDAEPLLRRALDASRKANGPHHHSLLPIMESYALVLDKLNKQGDAAKLRKKVKGILSSKEGSDAADM